VRLVSMVVSSMPKTRCSSFLLLTFRPLVG
jgi:hypothetical protein